MRIAPALAGAVRVALGILWINEAVTKYRFGFSGTDIALVAESALHSTRVPGPFALFAQDVLGPLAPFFGVVTPLWELALGIALVSGLLTLPAAIASLGTLLTYWSADQLIVEYPLMALASIPVIVWPLASRYFGITALARRRRRSLPVLLDSRWW